MNTQQTLNAKEVVVTEFNTVDNAMIQHFGDRKVRLITDIDTKKTGLFVNDELKLVTKELTITEYEATVEAAFILWTSMLITRMA